MNSKQRAYLGSLASTMDPIFQIGKASLTPEIIEALDAALEKRELIKVSVLKNCIDDPKEIASVIGERTHSTVVISGNSLDDVQRILKRIEGIAYEQANN